MLTFADLKKYYFYYWFGFPVIVPPKNHNFIHTNVVNIDEYFTTAELDRVTSLVVPFLLNNESLFIIRKENDTYNSYNISKWAEISKDRLDDIILGSVSPSFDTLGWTMRNVLVALKQKFNVSKIKVLKVQVDRTNYQNISHSKIITIECESNEPLKKEVYNVAGWERNNNKLAPKFVNLSSMMDSEKLAAAAVDLNLKLMKWRLSPSLDLESVKDLKCLLLGSGTLGCNVARNLLSWGVRKITFVDNGKISYSNPVRQWLYTYEDSKESRPKATTAAKRLKEIFPEVDSTGYEMTIPMPGHFVEGENNKNDCLKRIEKLSQLIDEHDVVFLLLDSREARWLPTMISTLKGKIVMNIALGFDTFVVMRHGIHYINGEKRNYKEGEIQLGCYFCNDIIAPSDTMKSRTLDQQCTVTRPGISSMASSQAVELLVSLLHHPDKWYAPSEVNVELNSETSTELGIVPHQIRGYLSYFTNLHITGHRYDKCVACSDSIIEEYKNKGNEFLINVFNDPKLLEDISGITVMKEHDITTEEWDDEDDFSM